MLRVIACTLDELERGVGKMVESCFKMPATPEVLLIEVKRKLEEKKNTELWTVMTPNLIDITLSDSWWDPWACMLPQLKNSLRKDLEEWLAESGFRASDKFQIHIDFGQLAGRDFAVAVEFVASPESILADSPQLVRAVLTNAQTGERHVLQQEESIVGRGKECQVRISDISVSKTHARIVCMDGSALVEDLYSTNGTRINREKVTGITGIREGESLAFGETQWCFELQH